MRIRLVCRALISLAAMWALADENQCERWRDPTMLAGRDDAGFFVRVKPGFFALRPGEPTHRSVSSVADWLGEQAGATVFYVTGHTEVKILSGEWRGEDPLSALKGFVTAGGLDVLVPKPDFWIIGEPGKVRNAAIVAYAYPLDPESQGWESAERVGDMERELLAQLAIRDTSAMDLDNMDEAHLGYLPDGLSWIGVGYYWVEGEKDTLLIVATHGCGYCGGTSSHLQVRALKVRLRREASGLKVECLWGAQVFGPLVPTVAEDFDGDGLRDFVFANDRDLQMNMNGGLVLSGADGRPFVRFASGIYVEKNIGGPKRFSALVLGDDRDDWPVLLYDPAEQTFEARYEAVAATGAGETRTPDAVEPASRRDRLAFFVREVGGPENAREYAMPGLTPSGRKGIEAVPARLTPVWEKWVLVPGYARYQELGGKLPLRVHYFYFSDAYLKKVEEARKAGRVP